MFHSGHLEHILFFSLQLIEIPWDEEPIFEKCVTATFEMLEDKQLVSDFPLWKKIRKVNIYYRGNSRRFCTRVTLYKWCFLTKQQSSTGKLYAGFELLTVYGTGFLSDVELKQIIRIFFSILVSDIFQKLLNSYLWKFTEMKSLPNVTFHGKTKSNSDVICSTLIGVFVDFIHLVFQRLIGYFFYDMNLIGFSIGLKLNEHVIILHVPSSVLGAITQAMLM